MTSTSQVIEFVDAAEMDARSGRPGSCHRCGWSGMLQKVSRRARVRPGQAKAPKWLCNDCVADLLHPMPARPVQSPSLASERPDGDGRRSVA